MNESTLVPREELSDLDWLARNVHEWPAGEHQPWCYVYMTYGGVMKAAGNFLDAVANPTMITIEQWLSRRAELQNKPSWNDWPQWDFMAQNRNGCWIISNRELIAGEDGRWHGYGVVTSKGAGEVLGDWRDTLEKRPTNLSEQAVTSRLKEATDNVLAAAPELMTDKYKFEPFTSIEDNQELPMTQQQKVKQDNGWFERGELPPVGVECEVMHRERWVVCDVIAHFQQQAAMVAAYTVDNGNALKKLDSCIAKYFRPIRTERDVLIEIIKKTDDTDDKIADAILAAGFKLEAK